MLRDGGWIRRARRVYLPGLLAVAVAGVWRLPAVLDAVRIPPRGVFANLLTEGLVIWRYVFLVAASHGQALVHDVHWVSTALDPAASLASALIAGCAAAAIRLRRSKPLIAFGIVWFLAALVPTSSVIPLRDAMTEPRVYLPAVGLFLAAASAFADPLAASRGVRALAIALLVVLAFLTQARTRVWADPLALWKEAAARAPESWQSHLGYGDALRDLHQCGPARQEYAAALQIFPANPEARAGLERCR